MAESFSASRGYLEKSSVGPNCVGFTKTEAITTSACARAVRTSERWPWCNAPMVGTKPTLLPARRASLLMAVTSAAEVRMSMGEEQLAIGNQQLALVTKPQAFCQALIVSQFQL